MAWTYQVAPEVDGVTGEREPLGVRHAGAERLVDEDLPVAASQIRAGWS